MIFSSWTIFSQHDFLCMRAFRSGRKPTCKIQNSKFGRGERPNFKFCILRRRVSVGRRRRVASVAAVTSNRGGRKPSCKIQNSKFDRGSGQILNFELCGVGSQPVAVVASCRVVSRRLSSIVVAFSPKLIFAPGAPELPLFYKGFELITFWSDLGTKPGPNLYEHKCLLTITAQVMSDIMIRLVLGGIALVWPQLW